MVNNTKTTPTKSINIPSIISANTYFWSPSGNAASRRRNEERHEQTVSDFLSACEIEKLENVEISFSYSESCKNVYKHFEVRRNGKKSNIRGLAAELRTIGIELV